MRVITHCHSNYSFDSRLGLEEILEQAVINKINVILLTDHDVCSLTQDEISMFMEHGVTLLKAVEFTTKEGIHIIGIGEQVINLIKPIGHYRAADLIKRCRKEELKVVLPHPSHLTGVCGNTNTTSDLKAELISAADAFEIDNYRYGKTADKDLAFLNETNPNLLKLVGADAHKKEEVCSFVNQYGGLYNKEEPLISFLFGEQPCHVYLKKRSTIYFKWKRFQKTQFYQRAISVLDARQRKIIKNFIMRKK